MKVRLRSSARLLVIVLAIGSVVHNTRGDVLLVPRDHPTIQGAIDAANDRDTVVVQPGTYVENIDFRGKAIHVQSVQPDNPANVGMTVIDGGSLGNAVTFAQGESPKSRLLGFTIMTSRTPDVSFGRGIYCFDSSPTIERCRIVDKFPSRDSAVIRCVNGSPTFSKCTIVLVNASVAQRVLHSLGGKPTFTDCKVAERTLLGPSFSLEGTVTKADKTIDFRPAVVAADPVSDATGVALPPKDPGPNDQYAPDLFGLFGYSYLPSYHVYAYDYATHLPLYYGSSVTDAVHTASRFVNFAGANARSPRSLLGTFSSPLGPGSLGFGASPFLGSRGKRGPVTDGAVGFQTGLRGVMGPSGVVTMPRRR